MVASHVNLAVFHRALLGLFFHVVDHVKRRTIPWDIPQSHCVVASDVFHLDILWVNTWFGFVILAEHSNICS